MKTSPSRTRAFTLIELLTVIAIIGILAAIIVPTVGKIRTSAKSAKSMSNLRQLAAGMLLYSQSYKGNLPAGYSDKTDNNGNVSATGTIQITWQERLYPFISTKNAHALRSNPDSVFNSPFYDTTVTTPDTVTFGINPYMTSTSNWNYKLDRVKEPNRVVLVGDMLQGNNDYARPSVGGDSGIGSRGRRPAFRHANGTLAQFAFADGHVSALSSAQLEEKPTGGLASVWYWW